MASVPGPSPDRPFSPPGAPAERPSPEPEEEQEEEKRRAADPDQPDWIPEPYDPDRERVEPGKPAAVP